MFLLRRGSRWLLTSLYSCFFFYSFYLSLCFFFLCFCCLFKSIIWLWEPGSPLYPVRSEPGKKSHYPRARRVLHVHSVVLSWGVNIEHENNISGSVSNERWPLLPWRWPGDALMWSTLNLFVYHCVSVFLSIYVLQSGSSQDVGQCACCTKNPLVWGHRYRIPSGSCLNINLLWVFVLHWHPENKVRSLFWWEKWVRWHHHVQIRYTCSLMFKVEKTFIVGLNPHFTLLTRMMLHVWCHQVKEVQLKLSVTETTYMSINKT